MRNASVSALIYEFLFDIYRRIDGVRPYGDWLPDDGGVMREAFNHEFCSFGEWSTSVLEVAGVVKALISPHLHIPEDYRGHLTDLSPYSYPLMTLEECRDTDFSEFETLDNYCYAMFAFTMQAWGWGSDERNVDLAVVSPRFLNEVAAKDDLFLIENATKIRFSPARYEEKVRVRWREMQIEGTVGFHRKTSV